MIKKLGVVTVGVAAGLMVAAPFASATEGGHGHGHDGDHKSSGSCNINGGNAQANGEVEGDALADALAQAPVGANALNLVCSQVLNDNISGNTIDVDVAGGLLPEVPIELPGLPT